MFRLLSISALIALNSGLITAHPMNDLATHRSLEYPYRRLQAARADVPATSFPTFPVGPNPEADPPSLMSRFIKDADYSGSTPPALSNPAVPDQPPSAADTTPAAGPAKRQLPLLPGGLPAVLPTLNTANPGHAQLNNNQVDVPPKVPAPPSA